MRSAVVLFIALTAVAGVVSGDDCVSEDNNVEQVLFVQLRDQLHSANAEFTALPDFNYNIMGFGVEWTGAKAGNFSSLSLTKVQAPASSSQLCKSTNGNIVQKHLSINVGFDDLEASFGSFIVKTPFFNIGGQDNAIALSGENLLVTVDTYTENNTCSAKLSEFQFTSWGNLEIRLGSGVVNFFLEKIFNNYANTMILNFLEEFGVARLVNNAVTTYAAQIIDATGQQQTVCKLVNLLDN
uniref:Uncharacterized protein n=1 Tax=Lygus hesperus TaxID=30085 RepID=A0A0K8TAK7_LYGHE